MEIRVLVYAWDGNQYIDDLWDKGPSINGSLGWYFEYKWISGIRVRV